MCYTFTILTAPRDTIIHKIDDDDDKNAECTSEHTAHVLFEIIVYVCAFFILMPCPATARKTSHKNSLAPNNITVYVRYIHLKSTTKTHCILAIYTEKNVIIT